LHRGFSVFLTWAHTRTVCLYVFGLTNQSNRFMRISIAQRPNAKTMHWYYIFLFCF